MNKLEYQRAYRAEHKEAASSYLKKYRLENKEKIEAARLRSRDKTLANKKLYREKNRTKIADAKKVWDEKNMDHISEYGKMRRAKNPEVIRLSYKKWYDLNNKRRFQERYYSNIQYRLSLQVRHRLYMALKGKVKSGSAIRDMGCSIAELRVHLEKQFQPGMNWENQGKWHIDHIIPLSSFDLEDGEQFLKACHYTNLQPLWAIDNIKKGSKIIK